MACNWTEIPCMSPVEYPTEIYNINIISVVGNSLSIILTALVLIGGVLFKEKRSFPSRIGLCMSFSSFFTAWFFILSQIAGYDTLCMPKSPLCTFQALGIQYFGSSLLLWWFVMCLNLYISIIHMPGSTSFSAEIAYHVLGWGVPLVLTIVPAAAQVYKFDGSICWIDSTSFGWVFGAYYAPVGLTFLLGIGLFVRVLFEVIRIRSRKSMGQSQGPAVIVKRYLRHFVFVVGVLILFSFLYVAESIVFLLEGQCTESRYFLWFYLQQASFSFQGLIPGVVFGLSKRNFELWASVFKRDSDIPSLRSPLVNRTGRISVY